MNEKTPMPLLSESWVEKLAVDREAKRKLELQKKTAKLVAGQKYGRLTAIRPEKRGYWIFHCECGVERPFRKCLVTRGISFSCGCYSKDVVRFTKWKHGATAGRKRTREYRSWESMKRRCLVPKDKKYPLYGGRGITVCERWLHSFENFLTDMGKVAPGLTLERIQTDGNYEPANCVWASALRQANNKRSNVRIESDGRTMTRSQWARFIGIGYFQLRNRLGAGMSIKDVIEAKKAVSDARKRVL